MRAITEFELIENGDNIMIGVSGGKDSIFLAYAMAMMKMRLKKNFNIKAVTINPMFSKHLAVYATIWHITEYYPKSQKIVLF